MIFGCLILYLRMFFGVLPFLRVCILISYYYIDGITLFESEFSYSVPNVITPNGDGINDSFFVNFPFEKMTITNRWGNVVYESDIMNSFWDGRNQNGDICSDGVYSIS